MAIEFTEEDGSLVEKYVGTALHRFKDGSVGFEETLGNLVAAIDLIARDDPAFRTLPSNFDRRCAVMFPEQPAMPPRAASSLMEPQQEKNPPA